MKEAISNKLKEIVKKNANFKCEYCLLPDKLSYYSFHIDHIISLKHSGNSDLENLAYSCPDCNINKGSDLATINLENKLIRFFNPRIDKWEENFYLNDGSILSKTEIADATIKILKMNDVERLIFRKQIIELGQF